MRELVYNISDLAGSGCDCGHLKYWPFRLGAFLALNIVVTFFDLQGMPEYWSPVLLLILLLFCLSYVV